MGGKHKKGCAPCQKIFIGFGAVLAIFIFVMGTMTLYTYATKQKPSDVVLQHFKSLQDGDIQSAYDLTAAAFKRNTKRQAFEKFVKSNNALSHIADVEILNTFEDSDEASVTGYLTCTHGHNSPINVKLTSELDEWRIVNIEVDQSNHSENFEPTK